MGGRMRRGLGPEGWVSGEMVVLSGKTYDFGDVVYGGFGDADVGMGNAAWWFFGDGLREAARCW
jgi:hypothetical protein